MIFLERNEKQYKINPKVIPRPNHNDDVYKNSQGLPFYITNEDTLPPYTNTYFIANESQNSNPKYIRSTLTKVPNDPSIISSSNLSLALVVQPFAEILNEESPIPKINSPNGIIRCKRCSSYINNKYKIDFNKQNKRVAICNLCSSQIELDPNNPLMKSEYLHNRDNSPELTFPTVDFLAPTAMKHTNQFQPHYLFMFDISQLSLELGFPSYIINSIQNTLDSIHNVENSKVAFAMYDHKSIKFFWCDKSDVKVSIMPDIERPFSPLPKSKLYLNVISQREEIDKVIERITYILSQPIIKNNTTGSICGAAIKAGVDSLIGNGGRVIIFNSNSCTSGYGSSKPREDKLLTNQEKERSLYNAQHDIFQKLAQQCLDERIVVDMFVLANTQFDFPTISQISSLTGGKATFYPINSSVNPNDYAQKLEKIHYDLVRILTRPNYYDVKFMLRNGNGLEVSEILGQFGRKLGQGFLLSSMDPDSSFSISLRLMEAIKEPNINFQLVCMFIDNFNNRYLRIFNISYSIESDIGKVYYHVDVDTMTKFMIHKELFQFYSNAVEKITIKESIKTKIINFLYFYRKKCADKSPMQQLILPASVKFIPLYLTSLLKKSLLRKNKDKLSINETYSLLLKLMREPTKQTIKYLYPKFIRIDDILEDQSEKVDKKEDIIVSFNIINKIGKHWLNLRIYFSNSKAL